MTEHDAEQRIAYLRETIRRNAVLYYEKDAPVFVTTRMVGKPSACIRSMVSACEAGA